MHRPSLDEGCKFAKTLCADWAVDAVLPSSLAARGDIGALLRVPVLRRENTSPPSLNLQNFFLTQKGAEVMIPTDVVYETANEFLSRYPTATTIELIFTVIVTDATGASASGMTRVSLLPNKLVSAYIRPAS